MSNVQLRGVRGATWPLSGWVRYRGKPKDLTKDQLEIIFADLSTLASVRTYKTTDGIHKDAHGNYSFTVPASHTRDLKADRYRVEVWLTTGTERYPVMQGEFTVEQSSGSN